MYWQTKLLIRILLRQLFSPHRNFLHQVDDAQVSGPQNVFQLQLQLADPLSVVADLVAHQGEQVGRVRVQGHGDVVGHFVGDSFHCCIERY